MAAASPEEFASRWWRVENSVTVAKKHGSTKFALVMKYRTSATHALTTYASRPFSSHEPSYAKLWDSKEEALQPENVQRFRDFVQRGFAHGGGSTSTPKRPHEDMEGGAQQEKPKLRARARSSPAGRASGSVKAAWAGMANFVKGRKKLNFRHGAVTQPNRKEQRKEDQALQNAHEQLTRSAYRQEQIEILKHAVHKGICTSVLVPVDEGDVGICDVSQAQSKRATIQCIVVLQYFMLLEALAQQNGEELPGGQRVRYRRTSRRVCSPPARRLASGRTWAELGLGLSDFCRCVLCCARYLR